MSRSDFDDGKKASGRQGGNFRKKSYSRGNAPIRKSVPPNPISDPNSIRLNRYLSNSGVCSRREADIYIQAGSVTVNGVPITEMGHKVKLTDEVKFDGRLLNPIKKEYVLLNKPKDFVTTTEDERGKKTVMGLISAASKTKLLPVDKLDKNAMGLMLFTNDTDLMARLVRPKNGLRKIYHIELNKSLLNADLKRIQEGLVIDDIPVRVQEISYVDNAPKNQIGIEIYSSRHNIVNRIFTQMGYEIVKLDRVVYASLTKKDLPRGNWRFLTEQEVINLGMIR